MFDQIQDTMRTSYMGDPPRRNNQVGRNARRGPAMSINERNMDDTTCYNFIEKGFSVAGGGGAFTRLRPITMRTTTSKVRADPKSAARI